MYTDRIQLIFDARHRLLKYGGKCESPHSHTFNAEIILNSERLDKMGLVADFVGLRGKIGEWIDEHWDDALLINDQDQELLSALNLLKERKIFVFRSENPTAQAMSKYLYEYLHQVYGDLVSRVSIWESPVQYKEYSKR